MVAIYHLVDLDSWEVLYVGRTCFPASRIDQHFHSAVPAIRDLFASRRVGLEVLRWVQRSDAHRAEMNAISDALAAGHQIVNVLLRSCTTRMNYGLSNELSVQETFDTLITTL